MRKQIYTTIIILFSATLFPQDKVIVPKSGTIVFESKSVITDEKLYQESLKSYKSQMLLALKEEATLERLTDGIKTDSTQLEMIEEMLDETFDVYYNPHNDESNFQYHHEFKDSIIYNYASLDNEILGSGIKINTRTGVTDNSHENYEFYSGNEIVSVKEFPKETKTIHGFVCFKVVYAFKEEDDSAFSNFSNSYINYRELWVTDKIKCPFHPVIRDRAILEKYYPLEINEYSDILKGFVRKYELIKLEIK